MSDGMWSSVKRIVGVGPKRPTLGMDVGIQTKSGFAVILPHAELLPVSKTERFSTFKDGQTTVPVQLSARIPVGSGEIVPLQVFVVEEVQSGVAGEAQIDVTITVDESGRVLVESVDLQTGRKQSGRVGSVEVVMTRW